MEIRNEIMYLDYILFESYPITSNRTGTKPEDIAFGDSRGIELGFNGSQDFKQSFQLGMPKSKEHYEFIKNSTIAFDITIKITPQ